MSTISSTVVDPIAGAAMSDGAAVLPALTVRSSATQPDGAWDRFVAAHPSACQYHQAVWPAILARAFRHEARWIWAEDAGRTVGVLPLVVFRSRVFGRFAVSLPFVNYGGILADDPQVRDALLARAIEETTAAGGESLELRHTERLFATLAPKSHKVAMRAALEPDPERQWQAIDRKVRNQVRKAEKNGIHVFRGGHELLPAFYGVFSRNMRDLGTPVYSKRFFHEVLTTLPDTTRVFCAWYRDRPVAASIVCWYGSTIEVPWASAIRDYNTLCPNVLLYWHMLRFAVEHGFRTFDFGRSTPNEGTFAFKRQWGAEPSPLVWEYWLADGRPLPDRSPKNPKFARAIDLWRRLPLGVSRLVGPHIVRNIP